jgi:hypothetical protein
MTPSEKLAQAFREVGDSDMEKRANDGYYGDFTSPLATPIIQLVRDCQARGYTTIARNAMNGDYDG